MQHPDAHILSSRQLVPDVPQPTVQKHPGTRNHKPVTQPNPTTLQQTITARICPVSSKVQRFRIRHSRGNMCRTIILFCI